MVSWQERRGQMTNFMFLGIVFIIFILKWGFELYSGNKLAWNGPGNPWVKRIDNPKKYWLDMGLEIALVMVSVDLIYAYFFRG
jgi:hypothetical protein